MECHSLVVRQRSPDGHLRSIAHMGQVAVAVTAGAWCPAPVHGGGRMSASLIVGVDPGRYGHGVVARTAEHAEVVRERVDNDAAAIDELVTRVVGLAGGAGQALFGDRGRWRRRD